MRKSKYNDLIVNQEIISLASFRESYNKSVPVNFPRASIERLKEFQEIYPSFFKKAGAWSIDKHRKRFMDWVSSQ